MFQSVVHYCFMCIHVGTSLRIQPIVLEVAVDTIQGENQSLKLSDERENQPVNSAAPDPYTSSPEFLHQVWKFHTGSAMADSRYNDWPAAGVNHVSTSVLLKYEENYDLLLNGFCTNIDPNNLPNTNGFDINAVRGRKYKDGCPTEDPGYADIGKIMMASGLNCPMPSRCVPQEWLADLEQVFLRNAQHLTKDELFQKHVANLPFVERRGDGVLRYMNYRFGLLVDFLIRQGYLGTPAAGRETVME